MVSVALAEQLLYWPDKRNALFFVGGARAQGFVGELEQCLEPSLSDLGLSLKRYGDGGCIGLTSRRMILEQTVDTAAQQAMADLGGVPSLVFLANEIYMEGGSAKVPYSPFLESEYIPSVGDLVGEDGRLAMPVGDEVIPIVGLLMIC